MRRLSGAGLPACARARGARVFTCAGFFYLLVERAQRARKVRVRHPHFAVTPVTCRPPSLRIAYAPRKEKALASMLHPPLRYNHRLKRVITAQDIPPGGEFRIPLGSIVTPSAREAAAARGVRIVEIPADQVVAVAAPERTIAIGADHGGFRLKAALKPILESLSLEIRDVGVHEEKPADYPDIALQVAELVASGAAARGVIIDGAGIGSSIAANKVPGIRAALCYDKASARNSREHNDSNVLTLGARLLTETQAEDVLRTWIATPFAGGRHQARVQKILDIERRYLK